MSEEGDKIKQEIKKTVCTQGWKYIEDYLESQVKRSESVVNIDISSDEKIIYGVRLAQAKRSLYMNFLDWINKQTNFKEK